MYRLNVQQIKKTINAVINKRDEISPNVHNFLQYHSDESRIELIISRNVISSLLTLSLKLILTQFVKRITNKRCHQKLSISTNILLEKK